MLSQSDAIRTTLFLLIIISEQHNKQSRAMELNFDHGPDGGPQGFFEPIDVLTAYSPQDVPRVFEALDRAASQGLWIAGYASYELGYVLEPKLASLMPPERRLPLMRFGLYREPGESTTAAESGEATLSEFTARWSEDQYAQAFAKLHAAIGAGDVYQGNLTFPLDAAYSGDPLAIYQCLRAYQPVGHGAMVSQSDGPTILCRSPERFFQITNEGIIVTRPMKGTQLRADDPREDAERIAFLHADEKNRAENLMIVDLLRNDISRVCQPGTVCVPQLFEVETYATVHQMVSQVQGQVLPEAQLSDVFTALYPCGSITGAPKIRAMEILSELEPWARDTYCGTIGWAAPDGRADFNVAIRTLLLEDGQATLNVGGGVVWDSTAPSEYEEALWKSRFTQHCLTTAT